MTPAPVRFGAELPQKKYFEFQGHSRTIWGWAKVTGMNKSTINSRIRMGWSIEVVFTTPIQPKRRNFRARRSV